MQQRRKRARTRLLQTGPPNETYSDDERYESDNIHSAAPAEAGTAATSSYTRRQSPANNLASRPELLASEPGNISDHRTMSSEGLHSPESHTLNVHDLSFILHPSHEPHQNSRRDDDGEDLSSPDARSRATTVQSMLNRACNLLGISQKSISDL
jgi:hypothetical protein